MALLGGAGALFGPLLGRHPAGAAVRVSVGELSELLQHPARRWCSSSSSTSCRTASPGLLRPHAGCAARCGRGAAARERRAHPRSASALRKAFGGLVAVDDLAFTVAPGEIVGLIGPNGSGKTTVLNLISGRAALPTPATSASRATPIARLAAHRIARLGIARTFQLVRVLRSHDVRRRTSSPASRSAGQPLWGAARRKRARERCSPASGSPTRPSLRREQLTYIDQKRLELARALALAPDLLLLDEWLAGLNPSELQRGHRADPLAAPRRPDHHPGRARDGRDPLAVRPLHRHECRPQDRRGTGRRRARRPAR